jgi:hypothetical protein
MNVSGKDEAIALFESWAPMKSEVRGVLEVDGTPEASPLLEFRGGVANVSELGVLIKGLSESGKTIFEFTLRVHAAGVEFSSRDASDATRKVFAGMKRRDF